MESSDATRNAALVSAPGTVTVDGRTYMVDKSTTAQIFSIYEWAVEQAAKMYNPFRDVTDALAGLPVTPEQTAALLTQAHQVKLAGEVPGNLITKCLRSNEGVAFQLWISARSNHADLTLEACNTLISDKNRVDIYVQLDKATGANILNKAMAEAGFTQPARPAENTGS